MKKLVIVLFLDKRSDLIVEMKWFCGKKNIFISAFISYTMYG
jgi:hypothetical protein